MKVLVFFGESKKYQISHLIEHVRKLDPSYEFVVEHLPVLRSKYEKIKSFLGERKMMKRLIKKHNPDFVFLGDAFTMHYVDRPVMCWLHGDVLTEIESERQHSSFLARMYGWLRYRQAQGNLEKYPIACVSDWLTSIVRGGGHPKSGLIEDMWPYHVGNFNSGTLYAAPHHDFDDIPDTKMELKHPCVGFVQKAYGPLKMGALVKLESMMKEMPDVMFYWVGDGRHKKMAEPLEKLPNFVSVGTLERDKTRQFLHSIDVYVLATDLESLGVSALEAQMMETPVIVSTTGGGCIETICYGRTGYSYDTIPHLKEHIRDLLDNPEDSKEMGRAGRRFVMDKFSWDKSALQFIKFSQRIVNGKKLPAVNLQP